MYKIDNQKGLSFRAQENYIQYLVITYNGKESEKEYNWITETSITLWIKYTSIKKKNYCLPPS